MGGTPVLPFKATDALLLCEAYRESLHTFEKVLLIEEIMWPFPSEKNGQGDNPEEDFEE